MRKILAITLGFAFALALFALAGCEQGGKQFPDGGSVGKACVSFIDVGKGDCILLQADESAALVDTGYDATADDVLSYLKARNVSHLDWVVLTHYDRDHVEGLRAIGKAIDIGKVYLPGYEGSDKNYQTALSAINDLKLSAQQVTEEQHLKLGSNDFSIFPSNVKYVPGTKGKEGNDNDVSLVATLTGDGMSYLFAGDLEEEGIAEYLKGERGQFDVLKMPHHGRKASNTSEFLESVKPHIAIITDSIDSPADKKTLKKLDAAGADVYCASTSGTVAVRSDGDHRYTVSE